MPRRTGQQARRPPSPSPTTDAARTLRELQAIGGRSRKVAYATFTRTPLVLWGAAWLIGYAALDTLPWSIAIPVGAALSATAVLGTWLSRSVGVVNGWERRVRLSWLVIMACSPLLVAIVSPVPARTEMIFLGALWGVAMLLLAVAAGDVPLGVVGAVIVMAAAAVRLLAIDHELLDFGAVAGAAMISLGVRRMRLPG